MDRLVRDSRWYAGEAVGLVHGLSNAVALVLFAVSWLLRADAGAWEPNPAALICSFVAVAIAGVAAWLGGELVERLGAGVDTGANLDAPSSLTHKHLAGGGAQAFRS